MHPSKYHQPTLRGVSLSVVHVIHNSKSVYPKSAVVFVSFDQIVRAERNN